MITKNNLDSNVKHDTERKRGRSVRFAPVVTLPFALMIGVANSIMGGAQEAAPAPLPVWKPQTGLLRYLARPTRVLKYTMQPPAGYAARQTQQPRLLAYTWRGAASQSGVTPNVALALAPAPATKGKSYTAERLIAGALGFLKRGHDDWTQTPVEQGQINGLPFARAYWTGTERQHKRKVRGVAYMAVDGATLISLQSQDMAPVAPNAAKSGESSDTPPASNGEAAPNANPTAPIANPAEGTPDAPNRLKLAETAMLTFRRYAAPKLVTPALPAAP